MVSVVIPTFNRADLIGETISSVLCQNLENYEIIVVDDGSNDNTEAVVKGFSSRYKNISFYKRPNSMPKGANSCRNFGFDKAKGEFVKFLDSDDLLVEGSLQKQLIFFSNSNINVCLGYGVYFNDFTKELEEKWSRNMVSCNYLYDHITNKIRWQTAGPLWRKSFFKTAPFHQRLKNSQEWLMHSIAIYRLNKSEIVNLQEDVVLIRRGNIRMSSNRSSIYYFNQAKARCFLFTYLMRNLFFSIKCHFQLIKQIVLFSFHSIRQFVIK